MDTKGAVNPLPPGAQLDESTSQGNFQMDADTIIPYIVVKKGKIVRPGEMHSSNTSHHFFNIVIVHDFFDTFERMQIFLAPLLSRYPGVQALLWNYPGQAFSAWRKDVLLNNEYLSNCLTSLLHHGAFSTFLKKFYLI